MSRKTMTYSLIGGFLMIGATSFAATQGAKETRVPVTFIGGHDTDRRDGGRPVVLIAAALGVPTETFRKAFSGVTPARGGEPDPEQVHRNKDALLSVLSPYGITNDRLDAVSNFYRYRPQRGERWRNTPAEAYATVSNGKIVSFTITNHGAGYSSPPTIAVAGFEAIAPTATLKFTQRADTNGSIAVIALPGRKRAME